MGITWWSHSVWYQLEYCWFTMDATLLVRILCLLGTSRAWLLSADWDKSTRFGLANLG